MVFFAASCLVFFGAANGLASQQVHALQLLYAKLVGDGWPNVASRKPIYYYFYIGDKPSYYQAFPVLQSLRRVVQNNGDLVDYVPYGTFPLNIGGYQKYPFFYREYGVLQNAGTIPDNWTQQDVDANINASYQSLSDAQKQAIKTPLSVDYLTGADGQPTATPHIVFPTYEAGTAAFSGGVYTYDSSGNTVVSFPDNTGYAPGFVSQPDGSYTPIYYSIENGVVTPHDYIPVNNYSSLSYDSDLNQYSLDIPDYSPQLNTIINKLDDINSQVDVTPNVNVNVNPTLTVEPQVIVSNNISVSPNVEANVNVSIDEDALYSYDNIPSGLSTNDLQLTHEEEAAASSLRAWETNIPLIGDSIDFGLTALLGRIPAIGTEYVWLDYTIGGSRSVSYNPLQGVRVLISLQNYRQVILALRGFLILFEALLFLILTYRNIREALRV